MGAHGPGRRAAPGGLTDAAAGAAGPRRTLYGRRHGKKLRASQQRLLAGCVQDRSILSPAGPAARRLSDLGWPVLVGFTVTSVAMCALIVWVAMRRSGTLAEHAPVDAGGGNEWVLIGGLAIPSVRHECQRTASTLIRVNPREADITDEFTGERISLPLGALAAIQQIDELLTSSRSRQSD